MPGYTSRPRETGALRWWWNPFRVPDGKPQLKQASTASESRAEEASRQHHLQHQHQHCVPCCYYIYSSLKLFHHFLDFHHAKIYGGPSIEHCNRVHLPSILICSLVLYATQRPSVIINISWDICIESLLNNATAPHAQVVSSM